MKRSVGLVVMTMIPQGVDNCRVLAAVLQRRGSFNHEKMCPESYPGCLQVICHGKLKGDEPVEVGLVRELTEELGKAFTTAYVHGFHGEILVESRDEEKEIVTFGALMPIEIIRDTVRLGPDSGGLVYVTIDQINDQRIVFELGSGAPGSVFDMIKTYGPIKTNTIAMFPDEIEAVKKAFKVFGEE